MPTRTDYMVPSHRRLVEWVIQLDAYDTFWARENLELEVTSVLLRP